MIGSALDMTFVPAFVFPGQHFAVHTSQPAQVSADGIMFVKRQDSWAARAPAKPVDIWATIGQEGAYTDVAKRTLPVASGNRIGRIGNMDIVPMHGGAYGAIIAGKRFSSIVTFDLAPRSAPMRPRPFNIDYAYVSAAKATLSGLAGGIIRASAQIEHGRITLTYVPLFEVTGAINLLGTRIDITGEPGIQQTIVAPIPGFAP